MSNYILETVRLRLITWSKKDIAPFAEMCADKEVMRYFPATLSYEETEKLVNRLQLRFKEDGYTYYVVELKETGEFIGFCGFSQSQNANYKTKKVKDFLTESKIEGTDDINKRLTVKLNLKGI